jgi:hypothetical protein
VHPGLDFDSSSPIDTFDYDGDFFDGWQIGQDAERVFKVKVLDIDA